MKRRMFILSLALTAAGTAWADEAAQRAIAEFQAMEKRAEAGEVDAMDAVGDMYAQGHGVPQDYAKARGWYEKAGDGEAMNRIAAMYYEGLGIPENRVKAMEWTEQAAQAGNVTAMHLMGYAYARGKDVPQDGAKAVAWYEKAAEKGGGGFGDVTLISLADLYREGKVVPQDYAKARQWYQRAADKGEPHGMRGLALMEFFGLGAPKNVFQAYVWMDTALALESSLDKSNAAGLRAMLAKELSPQEVERAQAKAKELLKAYFMASQAKANQGDSHAMFRLAHMHQEGHGVPRNLFQAYMWYCVVEEVLGDKTLCTGSKVDLWTQLPESDRTRAAAEAVRKAEEIKRNMPAPQHPARVPHPLPPIPVEPAKPGDEVQEDFVTLEKRALAGDVKAMVEVSLKYARGEQVPKDEAKAYAYREKAALAGDALSLVALGDMCSEGFGVPKDQAKACAWYEKAAQIRSGEAMERLGVMYVNGFGVPASESQAYIWYRLAEMFGSHDMAPQAWRSLAKGLSAVDRQRADDEVERRAKELTKAGEASASPPK